MQAEIVMIGTELLLGHIIDTNAAYMARTLADNGINLYFKTTVGDNRERILSALDGALNRADAVLTSGGLGPTEDDITRECVAELTGRPLEFRQELYDQLAERFARMRRPMSENNRKQAYAPQGATAIPNRNGTAPGLIVEDRRGVIICMPGVPRELIPMLADDVVPYLRERFGIQDTLHCRVLKVCGMGESRVDEAIADLIRTSANPKIGLLASPDAVKIRLSARADSPQSAAALLDALSARVAERLPGCIMGMDDDTIETVVDRLFAARAWTFAVAETHTGGMITQRLIAAGAQQLTGGLVTPPSRSKPATLDHQLKRMAQELEERFAPDCALAVAADIDRRTSAALFRTPTEEHHWEHGFAQLDEVNQLRTAILTLEHVRRRLEGIPNGI